jgi:TPR repeat protein
MTQPAEAYSDRQIDRSQMVLQLLQELSERLRKSESDRDLLKRELTTIRDTLQELDDRNGQTQRAYLALENKFDANDSTIDSVIRRLTGVEETIDKQSTELLGILHKLEDRFGAYDGEHKAHAEVIERVAEQFDRLDKRLEKLAQDKGRMARKLDALEFQLAETDDHMRNARMPLTQNHLDAQAAAYVEAAARSGLQLWTPAAAQPKFMSGPNDIPMPRTSWGIRPEIWTKVGQGVAATVLVVVIGALGYGLISSLVNHPGSPETTVAENAPKRLAPPVTSVTTAENAAIPGKGFFSKTVRQQMDQQITTARKTEDNDAARLMTQQDTTPLTRRVKRDTSLPRTIKAIEDRAVEGTAEAQHDMGALYTSGQSDVGVDYARAAFWFREAAYNGVANARYNLGVLYQQGLGVEKDIDQALSWYRAAALLDHPEARYNLGIAYVEGIGTSYNPALAAGYFEQAARSGVIEAAYNLGLILENGLIDEPRPFEALFWYKLSADRGSAEAKAAEKRLQTELKLNDGQWLALFIKMLAERPDLKALADSKQARSVAGDGDAPRVRIHTPAGKTGAGPTKINMPASAPAKKPDVIRAARVVPPDAPVPQAVAGTDGQIKPNPTTDMKVDTQLVMRLQSLLAEDGYFAGPATGRYGPITTDAIKRYQISQDLPVDGRPTQWLLAHILARKLAATAEPASGDVAKPLNN